MKTSVLLSLSLLFLLFGSVDALAQDATYRVGPKDLLEIRVLEIPELNLERRIMDNGMISLPLLGEVSVQGMSAEEVRNKLETMLRAKYVNRANVSIVVKEYANKPVTIVGAVVKPGNLPISGRWTLLQAISAAGGLAQNAGRKIYVLRTAENGLSDTLEIKTDDLFRNASAQWNIPILPSDVINIPAKSTVRIFVMGEVKTPGAHEFDSDDRLTLLSVLAKAGGITDRASKSVRIKRRGEDGKDVETVVNYNRIISGDDADPDLQADDVVIVKASFL
jgi:polysaccharide export outer membrane protein